MKVGGSMIPHKKTEATSGADIDNYTSLQTYFNG